MTRQCVNCPGAEDHSTAQCPLVSEQKNELRQIITDALVSMVSGVTGLVPPTGPGQIPDFIQAPIDRAVERISASLPVGVPHALTGVERKALVGLIELASHAFHVADNGEDAGGETISVPRCDMDDLGNALDSLDELPDDMPGYTLGPSGRAEWALRRLFGGTTIAGQESITPTVKAEQVQCDTCHGQGEICVGQQTFGYMSMQPPEPIMEVCPECGGEEAPSLPAAGSAVEEVEVVGYVSSRGALSYSHSEDLGYTKQPLMTVAQHQRIVAALSAQESAPERVSVPVELARKLVCTYENAVIDAAHWTDMDGEVTQLRALLASHGRGEV